MWGSLRRLQTNQKRRGLAYWPGEAPGETLPNPQAPQGSCWRPYPTPTRLFLPVLPGLCRCPQRSGHLAGADSAKAGSMRNKGPSLPSPHHHPVSYCIKPKKWFGIPARVWIRHILSVMAAGADVQLFSVCGGRPFRAPGPLHALHLPLFTPH